MTQQATAPMQPARSLSSHNKNHNRNGSGNISSIREWLASFDDNFEVIPSSVFKTEHERSDRKNSRSA